MIKRFFDSFWYGLIVGTVATYAAFSFYYSHLWESPPTVEAEPSARCYLINGYDRDGELRCKSENGFEYTLAFLKRTKK